MRLFDCVRSSGSLEYESYGTDPIAQNDRLCAKRDNQRPGARDCASTSAYWSGARPRHDTSGGFVWRAMPFRGFISRGLLSDFQNPNNTTFEMHAALARMLAQ